jgi:ATP-dependent DNA ligase
MRGEDRRTGQLLRLGEAAEQVAVARAWLGQEGFDGIVAKRLDLSYRPSERAMRKFKVWKTIDCVVAGLYRKRGTQPWSICCVASMTNKVG